MLESCVHLSHVPPVRDGCGQVVLEESLKSSDHQHVPGVAVIPDPAHHPRSTSGADDDLKNTNVKCSECRAYCKMSSTAPCRNGLATLTLGFSFVLFSFLLPGESRKPSAVSPSKKIVLTKEVGSIQVLLPLLVFQIP